jgi:hypothetical protein
VATHDDQQTTVLPADGQPTSAGSESAWAALVGIGIAVFAVLLLVFRPHRLSFLAGTILLIVTLALGLLVAVASALAAVTPRTGAIAGRTLAAAPGAPTPHRRRRAGWGKPQTWVKLVTALAGLLLAASTLLTVVHTPAAAVHITHHHAAHKHHHHTQHKKQHKTKHNHGGGHRHRHRHH